MVRPKIHLVRLFVITLMIGFSCSNSTGPEPFGIFQISHFHINHLDYSDLIYTGTSIAPLKPYYPTDSTGVVVFIYEGQPYYHPITIAQRMFHYLDSYAQTRDRAYLQRTELFSQKLDELVEDFDGAWFYPITFDFALHANQSEVMKAPWYSGIVHGRILSIYSRMYMLTGDEKYFEKSEKVFHSFLRVKNHEEPWITMRDEEGYFWIEEYPWNPPNHVLNGFMVGIFGLYDYYLIKKDAASKQLLLAALTTLRRYIGEYRHPLGISYYCLTHKIQSMEYHQQHIEFLTYVYNMTGDTFFRDMAYKFSLDSH